ncbi:hypothetical protein BJX65DRAFT_287090 [Aspergillus insuetus]
MGSYRQLGLKTHGDPAWPLCRFHLHLPSPRRFSAQGTIIDLTGTLRSVEMPMLAQLQSKSRPIHAQPQSRLFSLPYELRILIYEAVFSHNVIHLATIDIQDTYIREKVHHTWCIDNWDARLNYAHVACSQHPISAGHLLGLPLTCRRLYLETIQVLYAQQTFSMGDKHAHTFWNFYRKTPMCHLNALRSLRLITTILPPAQHLNSRAYSMFQSLYVGAWQAIAGLPNLQSLLVTSTYAFAMSREDIMRNADFINPMKTVQQRGLERFDIVLQLTQAFFPRDVGDVIRDRNLLWECLVIETGAAGAGGSAGLWEGIHPVCRLIGMNVAMKHAPVPRQILGEKELMAWIDQFAPAPSDLGFNGADAKVNAKRLHLYKRWPGAQNGHQGPVQEFAKAAAEAATNAVKEKYQHVKVACELQAQDLEDINRAVDLESANRVVKYLYKYPELPDGDEEPTMKYLIGA